MNTKSPRIVFSAAASALGVFVYVLLVAWLMFNGEKLFGKIDNFWGPAMILLLLVFSVAIVGSLLFGRSVWFYLEGHKKESVKLLFYTLFFLFVETLIIFVVRILVV